MSILKNKTVFISGASRGIGKSIALKLASEGANIIVTGKTGMPHAKLRGTIFQTVDEIKEAGGNALPVVLDVRDDYSCKQAVQKAVDKFGGIDILINNASAISLTPTEYTQPKHFDLMQSVNVRGTFFMTQHCLPHLKKSEHAHIINLSPPLNMNPEWFGPHVAYSITKYSMSMLAMGWAEEFKKDGVGVNCLWPMTTIATAAIEKVVGDADMMERSRKPEIVADCVFHIVKQNPKECTGNFFIDEEVLEKEGITNLKDYAVNPEKELQRDLFV